VARAADWRAIRLFEHQILGNAVTEEPFQLEQLRPTRRKVVQEKSNIRLAVKDRIVYSDPDHLYIVVGFDAFRKTGAVPERVQKTSP
jgi:hypothetical protein